jgi:hypothetical protein
MYSASAVEKYNASSSLLRFDNKNNFSFTFYADGVVVVNSEVAGLAPRLHSFSKLRLTYTNKFFMFRYFNKIFGHSVVRHSVVGHSAVGQNAVGQNAVGQNAVGQNAVGQNAVE